MARGEGVQQDKHDAAHLILAHGRLCDEVAHRQGAPRSLSVSSHERGWLELSSSRGSKCTHFLHQLSSEVPAIRKHAAPSQYGWDTRCKATRVA